MMSVFSERTEEALKLCKTCVRNRKGFSSTAVSLPFLPLNQTHLLSLHSMVSTSLQVCLPAWAKCRIELRERQYCTFSVLNCSRKRLVRKSVQSTLMNTGSPRMTPEENDTVRNGLLVAAVLKETTEELFPSLCA